MPVVAFALREHDDEGNSLEGFAATVALPPDGETLYVHKLLEKGDGTIVTEDEVVIAALRDVYGLEEVPVPSKSSPASAMKPKGGGSAEGGKGE